MGTTQACNSLCEWDDTPSAPFAENSIMCDAANVCSGGQAARFVAITYGDVFAIAAQCAGTTVACCQYDVSAARGEVENVYLVGASQPDEFELAYSTYDLEPVNSSYALTAWIYGLNGDDEILGSRATTSFTERFFTSNGEDVVDVNGGGTCYADLGDDDDVYTGTDVGEDNVDLGAGNDKARTYGGTDTVWDGLGDDQVVLGEGQDRHYIEGGDDVVCTDEGAWFSFPTGSFACEQQDPAPGDDDFVFSTNASSGTDTIQTSVGNDQVCINYDGATIFLQGDVDDELYVNPGVTSVTANCGASNPDGKTNRSGLTNCTTTGGPTSCPFSTSSWPIRP